MKELCDSAVAHCEQAWEFLCSSRLIARKEDDEKFQQVVYVNYKLEKFIFLLDVRNSVYD